jgi:hypothetical protein
MDFYRGVVRSYDEASHTANVLLVGSMSRVLLGVAVSQQIGPELMVEGAPCGVLFFAEGATGVVVCTFGSAPSGWVTSGLIKDGTVAPADLSFSPATPEFYWGTSASDQEVENSWATYQSLSKQVTVPAGKTFNVLAMGSVEFDCTSFTGWNIDVACIYKGEAQFGAPMGVRTNAVNERSPVTVLGADQISATATYSLRVYKAVDRNTEVCHRGTLAGLWWEET